MPHRLRVVPGDARGVLAGLRAALDGGEAIHPVDVSTRGVGAPGGQIAVPDEVDDGVALVVRTSGSTGNAKLVALGPDALLASARATQAALSGPGQWLLALPAHYIAGINVLVRSLLAGTEPVTMGIGHIDPLQFLRAADSFDHDLRFTALVPTQLASLLAEPRAVDTLRRFDCILLGGQATPPGLLARAREQGISVTRTYGSSETSGGCVYDGRPIGRAEMRVVEGEIELGGPTLAWGYLGDEARTRASFHTDDAGRWYRTSDSGHIDGGVLTVTGRLDDVIVSGGIKVAVSDIERVVTALPGLADAVVASRADERWGEVPVVYTTASAKLDDVRRAVGAELGAAARPADIVTVTSIPRLPSGKPDRAALGHR